MTLLPQVRQDHFDFSNVTGLQDGLTAVDYTGSGDISVALRFSLIPPLMTIVGTSTGRAKVSH
jgi:hypothetical protein